MFCKSIELHILKFLIFYPVIVFGQLSGKVITTNGKPIPFTSVIDVGQRFGTYCNELGEFFLKETKLANDTLIFSCLGFEKKKLSVKDIEKSNNLVVLRENSIEIPQVIIKPSKTRVIEVGNLNDKVIVFGAANKVFQLEEAIWIPNKGWRGKILSISFFIGGIKFKAPFRVRLYKSGNHTPDTDLSPKSIIVQAKHKGWVEVKIEQYDNEIPIDGFYASMEWLITNDPQYEYKIPIQEKEQIGFGQSLGMTLGDGLGWHKDSKSKFWKNKTIHTPMIKAKLMIYKD